MNKLDPTDKIDSQTLLNQIVLEFMREQKRKRYTRWVIRGVVLLIILVMLGQYWGRSEENAVLKSKPHVGIIDVQGTIFDLESGSADNFIKGIDKAYKSSGLQAIIFRINSPGGSPVQADYIYNAIQFYRQQHPKIKTYAVCVDICASAAYYIATAAEEIYANPASMVGSIGVLYNGFGFSDALKKVGVTRRLQTAGVNKNFLDPFSPENAEQKAFLQTMLDDVHQQFINKVKEGRGKRLRIDALTFSGLFWTGQQAQTRGLIDGFASAGQLARQMKVEKLINYTYKQSVFEQFSKSIGEIAVNPLMDALGLNKSGIQM